MKEQKLISMVEFVKEHSVKECEWTLAVEEYDKIKNYANFLSQPLTLGMFVPCDENGEVLKEPDKCDCENLTQFNHRCDSCTFADRRNKYQQAKERVLFEGFDLKGETMYFAHGFIEFDKNGIIYILGDSGSYKAHTIEDVIFCRPTLTQNAIKTIYG